MSVTIDDIKQRNKDNSGHWFDPDTMSFFKTRLSSKVYGNRYFVTSEQMDAKHERLYTVREARSDGSIQTVGNFNDMTSKEAHKMAKELSEHN